MQKQPTKTCLNCGKETSASVYKVCLPCSRKLYAKKRWENIETFITKTDSCWIWNGSMDGKGYGRYRRLRKHYAPHRLMYEKYVGPIPKGLYACHSCDNKKCCNPKHIFTGTNSDNIIDAYKKGFKKAKLSSKQVLDIRTAYRKTRKGEGLVPSLAKKYGVVTQSIYNVLNKITWDHLVDPSSAS